MQMTGEKTLSHYATSLTDECGYDNDLVLQLEG